MRRVVAATAVLVACAVLAGALATGAVAQEETQTIENCTVVDQPGEYELAGDVTTNESQTCIEVRAGDVVIDGNGHAIDGPGAAEDGTDTSAAGILVDGADANVTVRNVAVNGFDAGVKATGTDTVEASEITVEHNGDGLVASGSDLVVDNSSIRANDGNGVELDAGASLTSADSYVNYNNGHGIVATGDVTVDLFDDETVYNDGVGLLLEDGATADVTYTTVAGNGDDGIRAVDASLDMEDVNIKENDGYELDAREGHSNATDLDFNLTVVTAFENEAIATETVGSEELPERSDNATATGDGLEIVGSVGGQVEMVFDVETDDDTVEVRRHDGDGWTTVAENVSVNSGTAEYTADASGTYAPVESASDEQEDADGSDEGEQSDESDDEQEDADESDDSSSDSDSSSTSPGYSGSSTSSGSSGSSSSERGGPLASTPTPTPTEEPAETETDDESEETTETETGDETQSAEQDDDDDVAAAHEADDEADGDEDGASFADGPGFTGLAALLALLASAALAQRRR